ncbi:hypothetical protein [Chitinophaga vietnamensis]|nr:hypothetical protein [Chitinophaga vietnamensis]
MLKTLVCSLLGVLLFTACKKKNKSGSNCDRVECLTINSPFKFRLVDDNGHNLTFGSNASISPDSITLALAGNLRLKPAVVDSLSNDGYFYASVGNLLGYSAYPAPLPLRIGRAGQEARILALGMALKPKDCCDFSATVVKIDDKPADLQPDRTGAVNILVK